MLKNWMHFKERKYRKTVCMVLVGIIVLLGILCLFYAWNQTKNIRIQKFTNIEHNTFVEKTVKAYAKAFCDRDGDTIVGLYQNKKEAYKNKNLQVNKDGSYVFGESSPWPFSDAYDIEYHRDRAIIHFYAVTSEPHVTVYNDILEFVKVGNKAKISSEKFTSYDEITTKKEFDLAYLRSQKYRFYDYAKNAWEEPLLAHAKDQMKPYVNYQKPDTSAAYILNLTKGTAEVQNMTQADCTVKYTFLDGSEVLIPMYLYKGNENDSTGIWLVEVIK